MELLRRALLVGCTLSGLWLLRLSPLDPVLSVTRVDFGARQRDEAAATPEDRKTDAQRRRDVLPLSVYIEETLQFNIFPAAGPEWERFLAAIDAARAPQGGRAAVFFDPDEPLLRLVAARVASGGGTTYISLSRPGGDVHYEVVEHRWTRDDFTPGRGFQSVAGLPASLLHPFRPLGVGLVVAGAFLFVLLPATIRITGLQAAGLAGGLLLFAAPLVAVGGSAQALTRAPWLTAACWLLSALGLHVFAAPRRTAPHAGASRDREAAAAVVDAQFVREGLVFLVMAVGPVLFLVWGTLILWNR